MPLTFNSEECKLILTGRKKAFLRDWPTDKPKLAIGAVQTLHDSPNSEPLAHVRVRFVKRFKLGDLTDSMVRGMAGRTRDEVINSYIAEHKKTGAMIGTGTLVWYVEFDVISREQ